MCGIAGQLHLNYQKEPRIKRGLEVMNMLQAHRGPDGEGKWLHAKGYVGFAHRRLSIIDMATGDQPMTDKYGNTISFNGEIYNYRDLKKELKEGYVFKTSSDTEVILAAYAKWGEKCVEKLRGMFAFAIWDEKNKSLFLACDRFGIKPLHYAKTENSIVFASEAKTLLPFLKNIETDQSALKDYLTFQFCLGEKTLFKDINQLLPAHCMTVKNGRTTIKKYWEVEYNPDWNHTKEYFRENTKKLLEDSIKYHHVSDVEVGAYVSGGIDSSLIAILSGKYHEKEKFQTFTGKFDISDKYDESKYAEELAKCNNFKLHQKNITSGDFIKNIQKVIYHLDYPIVGPGSFPQYMVSELAAKHVKVVLGGQGGDETFGGYARYLIAYFEQCIKGAIEGTLHTGNFVVTYESIIPNLATLREYKPLIGKFWQEGLFEEKDKRYFRLISRMDHADREINWELFADYQPFEAFQKLFWSNNIQKESYFDSMTHFDFKTLLPALLHVEDRMSMAHGLESRVPILDHPLIEFAATVPSNIKFADGNLKHLLKETFRDTLPARIAERKDKMGFPVPLSEWVRGDLKPFITDIFSSQKAKKRAYIHPDFDIRKLVTGEGELNRKLWGLLSLELWQQEFHDRSSYYKNLINKDHESSHHGRGGIYRLAPRGQTVGTRA